MFGGYTWKACSFLKGNPGGVDLGVGLGREEGRETVVWIKYKSRINKLMKGG